MERSNKLSVYPEPCYMFMALIGLNPDFFPKNNIYLKIFFEEIFLSVQLN